MLKLTHLVSARTPNLASTGSQHGCSHLLSSCLVSKEYYSMGIFRLSTKTQKRDPNNIYVLEDVQKQAVLCGVVFLSWFRIFGAPGTQDKLGPVQTPELTELTYASMGKSNVIGVGGESFSGAKIVYSRGHLSCHIITEIISLLPAGPSDALLRWLPSCYLSK